MTRLPIRFPFHGHTRRRAVLRSLASILVVVVLVLVSGGMVNAATRTFSDPDDSPSMDIRNVRVAYGDWLRIRVEHDGRIEAGQVYAFWIDTKRGNPGPEYYAAFRPNAELPPLKRVSGFGDRTKTETTCDRLDGSANMLRPHSDVTFKVAGGCLGNPQRIRVSVHFIEADGSDWAPAARQFYPWVGRN